MSEAVVTAIAGVASLFVAGWLGNLTGKKTAYREQALQFDELLRGDRARCYPGIWVELKVLAFARELDLSSAQVSALLVGMTDWYYTEGGLYLSRRSQLAYVSLMEAARDIVTRHASADEAESAELRRLGSRLRSSLTQDLGGRADSPVTRHE